MSSIMPALLMARASPAKIIRFASLRSCRSGAENPGGKPGTYRRGIVISDGVFSMDGDIEIAG